MHVPRLRLAAFWLLAALLQLARPDVAFATEDARPSPSAASAQGRLLIRTAGEPDQQADVQAKIYSRADERPAAWARLGQAVALPPGTYRVVLDVLGGSVSRERVLVKAGRISTVVISEVAHILVQVLDKNGQELGFGVEVYDGVSNELLGAFLSGERILALPGVVHIKVDVPPQSRWWRGIELHGGGLQELTLREQVRSELWVRPWLDGQDASSLTHVTLYEAGTQKEVARSEPGPEHRFSLDAGAYDVLVTNPTGRGQPFVLERTELAGEQPVNKDVHLDATPKPAPPATPADTQVLETRLGSGSSGGGQPAISF